MRIRSAAVIAAIFMAGAQVPCVAVTSVAQAQSPSASAVKTLKGTVINPKGKPVAGASVYSCDYPDPPELVTKATDKAGRFIYTPKSPSEPPRLFLATAPGYSFGMAMRSDLCIKLQPEHTLKGKVVDESGRPIVGAKVNGSYLFSGGSARAIVPGYGSWLEAVTAKDGSFTLGHMSDPESSRVATCDLQVSADGFAGVCRMLRKEQIVDGLSIVVPKACALKGTLHMPGSSGPAPAGVKITVDSHSKWPWITREYVTDKNGQFKVTDLPPGTADIALAAAESTPGAVPPSYVMQAVRGVAVTPGATKAIDLKMTTGALIKGAVIDTNTGEPLADATVGVTHFGLLNMDLEDTVTTDSQGNFTVRVVAGGVKLELISVGKFDFLDDPPKTVLIVAEGDEKTGVEVKADMTQCDDDYEAATKPVTPGFEVKPGTYSLRWDSNLNCTDSCNIEQLKTGFLAKKMIKKLPQLASKQPRISIYRLDSYADGLIAAVIDESKGTGKGYDTVYIDANRDWDLTNDKPLEIEPLEGQFDSTETEWLQVVSTQGRLDDQHTANPVFVRIGLSRYDTGNIEESLERKGGWRGVVDSNKGQVQCALIDNNSNGVYNDRNALDAKKQFTDSGDDVYIDTNAYGRLYISGYGPQLLDQSPVCRIGDKFYSLEVSACGDKLHIKPYTGPMGSLSVQARDVLGGNGLADSFRANGDQGSFSFEKLAGKSATLPAGRYKLSTCDMILSYADSSKLKVSFASGSPVEVKPDRPTVAQLSGPFTSSINPKDKELKWKAGSSRVVDWRMKIGDDIEVASIADRAPQSAPKAKFFDKTGKLQASVTAGYT